MRLLCKSELNNISGAHFAETDCSYMCTYSLVQYYNSRFSVLENQYNGDTSENASWYDSDKQMQDMYQSWALKYCSNEIINEFLVV